MKKLLALVSLFILVGCSNKEVKYDGSLLNIAVIGDVPELNQENIRFEAVTLDLLRKDAEHISSEFDTVMITPVMFEEASDDSMVDVYKNLEMPIIFFNSEKRHFPFTRTGATYKTAHWDSLNDGSHTTIYLYNNNQDREDAWYFFLEDEKKIDGHYKDIFEKVESIQ